MGDASVGSLSTLAQLDELQRLAGAVAASDSEHCLLEAAAHALQRQLGADAVMGWLLRPSGAQFALTVTANGSSHDLPGRIRPALAEHGWPTSDAVAPREIEVLCSAEELVDRFPPAREASLSHATYVVSPLAAGDEDVGVMVLSYREARALDQGQRLFLSAASTLCAGALRQARLHGELQRQHERARFRAEAGRLLGSSLDYELTVRRVADLAGPAVADACLVALTTPDGHLSPVAASHHDPGHQVTIDRLIARSQRVENPFLLKVMETGEPLVMEWISSDVLNAVEQDDEHRRLLDSLGATAALAVPIECLQERRGILLVVSTSTPPTIGAQDLPFVQDLADHAALAIANAETHRRAGKLAAELAEALESRVIIEQAKGMLAERHQEGPEEAFARLRQEARRTQQRIHRLAERVVSGTATI